MTTLEQTLAEIKARCDAATEGPWIYRDGIIADKHKNTKGIHYRQTGTTFKKQIRIAKTPTRSPDSPISHEEFYSNFYFMVHARSDVPMLLEMVEYLRGISGELVSDFTQDKVFEKIAEKYK